MKFALRLIVGTSLTMGLILTGSSAIRAQDATQQQAPAADNSKANQQEENKNANTAERQKENSSDREMARQIRRAIIRDKSLSTYAHNVKVISHDGMVTLKGPVRSDDDKQAIEAKAKQIAGDGKVDDQLQVQPKQ